MVTGLLAGFAINDFLPTDLASRADSDAKVLVSDHKSQIRGGFHAMIRFGTGHLRIFDETGTVVVTTPAPMERQAIFRRLWYLRNSGDYHLVLSARHECARWHASGD